MEIEIENPCTFLCTTWIPVTQFWHFHNSKTSHIFSTWCFRFTIWVLGLTIFLWRILIQCCLSQGSSSLFLDVTLEPWFPNLCSTIGALFHTPKEQPWFEFLDSANLCLGCCKLSCFDQPSVPLEIILLITYLGPATVFVVSLRQSSKLAPHSSTPKSDFLKIFELWLYELHSYVSCLEGILFPFLWNVISFGPPVNDISTTSFSPAFESTEVN